MHEHICALLSLCMMLAVFPAAAANVEGSPSRVSKYNPLHNQDNFTPFIKKHSPTLERPADKILLPVVQKGKIIAHVQLLTDAQDDVLRIEAKGLAPWVENNLSEDYQGHFLRLIGPEGTLRSADTGQAGFTLSYDENNIAFLLDVDVAALQSTDYSLQNRGISSRQNPTLPADLSGFVNFRSGQDYRYDHDQGGRRQPFRTDIDGAVNLDGWVLEGRSDYLEGSVRPWRRGDVRIVRDWPDSMVRFTAGDLSYPVENFQSYQPAAGISISRNFSLQPYRVTEPSGQTSFVLQSPSRVDVFVNGQRMRTLQLEPGPYDVSDFPLVDGSNDVTLLITDATGRTEEKRFSLLSDQKLLKEGLHEYSYSLGIKSSSEERLIQYESDEPVFSGFHRAGLSDSLTGSANLQADKDTVQAGLSVIKALSWGTWGLETSVSHAAVADTDIASKISYSYHDRDRAKSFSTSAQYSGADFVALGQDEPQNPASWQIAARYNQMMPYNINFGFGGRYRISRESNEDDWSYSANIRKALSNSLTLNVSAQHQREEGAGMFVGVTWSPHASKHVVTSSVDTLTRSKEIQWDWRDGKRWQVSAGANHSDERTRGTASASFVGQRMEGSVIHDVTRVQNPETGLGMSDERTEQRTQFRAGAALAFVNGHIALSRPISNSFVLLARHNNLEDYAVGVNPELGDHREKSETNYEAEIDWAGPAVIPDTVPYIYRPIKVDTRNLPVGYDIGQDHHVFLPSYKSGTVITVGSAANVYIDGFLSFFDQTPASLQAGLIENMDDPEFPQQEFFTNRDGRFRISQVQPGSYKMTLHAYPDQSISVDIPEDIPVGQYDVGTLSLAEEQ